MKYFFIQRLIQFFQNIRGNLPYRGGGTFCSRSTMNVSYEAYDLRRRLQQGRQGRAEDWD
jgi:hypothetical protein